MIRGDIQKNMRLISIIAYCDQMKSVNLFHQRILTNLIQPSYLSEIIFFYRFIILLCFCVFIHSFSRYTTEEFEFRL